MKGSVWRDAYREQIAQVSKEALSKVTAEEAELEAKLMKRKRKQSESNKSRHVKVKVTAKLMKRKRKQSESDKGHHVKVKASGGRDSYREDRTDTTRVPGLLVLYTIWNYVEQVKICSQGAEKPNGHNLVLSDSSSDS